MFLHQSAVTAVLATAPAEIQGPFQGILQQIIAAALSAGQRVPWGQVLTIAMTLALGGFTPAAWAAALPQLEAILAGLLGGIVPAPAS